MNTAQPQLALYPMVAGAVIARGARATCLLPGKTVEIRCPGEVLHALLARCDGQTPLEQILQELGQEWDGSALRQLVEELRQQGVICDANDIAQHLWLNFKNPRTAGGAPSAEDVVRQVEAAILAIRTPHAEAQYFSPAATQLATLLRCRRSVRGFSGAMVALDQILALLWAAYGAGARRTVPSAGGIYPLRVALILLSGTGTFSAGVYQVHYLEDGRVGLRPVVADIGNVIRAWTDPAPLNGAQGVIVLSGRFGPTAAKYGSRAGLFVPLEAGHAAQNTLLAAAELDIGAVELGSFIEDELVKLLGEPEAIPLTTIAFGAANEGARREDAHDSPAVDFRWVDPQLPGYRLPFFLAAAAARDNPDEWCWGRDQEAGNAYAKAVAEALERLACVRPAGVFKARMDEVDGAVAPTEIAAYLPSQYAAPHFPYKPFDPHAEYQWKIGEDLLTGSQVAVLADFVYYAPRQDGAAAPYTSCNTSGVAAYPTREGALERAVLELIERDAFMLAWLGRQRHPAIAPSSLPRALAVRLRALEDVGFKVTLKSLSGNLVPVVLVFAQSLALGVTRVAACAHYDAEQAVHRALMEAESTIAVWLTGRMRGTLQPEQVAHPQDHCDLYTQRRYFRRADHLGATAEVIPLSSLAGTGPADWCGLMNLIERQGRPLLWFDLTFAGASLHQGGVPLVIGRAIVPGLVPISFGYGTEPLGLPRVAATARIRSVPYFPHPFN